MTKLEFTPIFNRLLKDYSLEKKFNSGQIDAYFEYLRHHDRDDFIVAAKRIPACEIPTAYKPFPTAECIQNYILDAKEQRLLQRQQSFPKNAQDLYRRGNGGLDDTPGGKDWAKLMALFITNGRGTYRVSEAQKFREAHPDWIQQHPALNEVLSSLVGGL